MYRLKLTKARSYTRGGVTVTQEKPLVDVEDAETANALLASGYFTLVSSPDVPGAEPDNSGTEGTEADGSGTEGTEPDSGAVAEIEENPEAYAGWTDEEMEEYKANFIPYIRGYGSLSVV